jgi:hypothetical protein
MRYFRLQLLFFFIIFISSTYCFYLNVIPTTEKLEEGSILKPPEPLRCGPKHRPDYRANKCRKVMPTK